MFSWFVKNKKRTVRIAIAWTVLILVACLLPGNEVPNVHVPFVDKYVHFIIFAGFSFLWLCTLAQPSLQKGFWVFMASLGLGYLVEVLQGSGITSGRSYDMYDVLADTIGGLIGIIIFYIAEKITAKT